MSLSIFYTPDGHRRFAEAEGVSLVSAYRTGVEVLVREFIVPIIDSYDIESIDIFCLSRRNLLIRKENELADWLRVGREMLDEVVETCSSFANIRTVGDFLPKNLRVDRAIDAPTVRFFIGSSIEDTDEIFPVDLFIRSGGGLRLSGAPRALLGDDTEILSIATLHPYVRFNDVREVIHAYESRYLRRTDTRPG